MAQNGGTLFNDPVHGYIELDPLLVHIIHTPQFQRMKDIKQLGASYWVYPGASHNRFEHSLGTAYLAGRMIERLRDIHKGEIKITDKEVLCVKIAALCHDLGHGPFSHVFDHQMKKKLMKLHEEEAAKSEGEEKELLQRKIAKLSEWEHEVASCEMFDHMVFEANPSLQKAFKEKKIGKKEQDLVKELIKGKRPGIDTVTQMATVDGKQYLKWFLFEIVANKRNGIDCDKFDYFARDCLNLGVKSNFDHLRYMQNIRILPVGDQLQLCTRDKLAFNIYELFHTRWSLHHRVYQHKTTKAIEDMITDAFMLLNHKYNFSQAIFNMEEYAKLTDSIFYEILRSKDNDEGTRKAKEIIRRIQRRELYKFCGEKQLAQKLEIGGPEIAEEIAKYDENLRPNDLHVSVVKISFGMEEQDPVDSVVFYDKKFAQVAKPNVSEMLPPKFSEQYIRVYDKKVKQLGSVATPNSEEREKIILECFNEWYDEFAYRDEPVGDQSGFVTPMKRPGIDLQNFNNPARKKLKF